MRTFALPVFLCSSLLWSIGGIQSAEATTMVPLSVEQIVDISNAVVRGTVTEVWTEPDPETQTVWTYAQVEVSEVFKGAPGTVIVIEQPGGAYGTTETMVEGAARFSIGEEGYFFVEQLDGGRWVSTGMFQGKFNVIMDPYTRSEIAVRFPVHPKRDFDHRFIPLPPQEQRLAVDAFELQIEDRVEMGWDGRQIPGISNAKLQERNLTRHPVTSSDIKGE